MEYFLDLGKPEATKAMKAGSARHAKLEEEVYFGTPFMIEFFFGSPSTKLILNI